MGCKQFRGYNQFIGYSELMDDNIFMGELSWLYARFIVDFFRFINDGRTHLVIEQLTVLMGYNDSKIMGCTLIRS